MPKRVYSQKPQNEEHYVGYGEDSLQNPPVPDEVGDARQDHVAHSPTEVPHTRDEHPPIRAHHLHSWKEAQRLSNK